MLRASLFLAVALVLVAISASVPIRRELYRSTLDEVKRDGLPPKDKRTLEEVKRDGLPRKAKRDLGLPPKSERAIRIARGLPPKTKRHAVEKRTLVVAQQPAIQVQVTYYQLPDGRIVDEATLLALQGQVQYQPQYQPAQPSSSSGGFLGFLSKPFNAAGDIVKAVGDTASNIVALPFNVVDTAIKGVGLDNTGVGQLATGVLDVGEAILQTPVQVASSVLQAPLRLAGSLDE